MIIVSLIILIISAAIVIWFVWMFYSGQGGVTSSVSDALCIFSTNSRSALRIGGQEFFPELCSLRTGRIEADNLRECPYFNSELEEKDVKITKGNQDYVYSICAAEQYMDLVRRCWYIRGKGDKDAGNFECFRAEITAPEGVNIRISTSNDGPYTNDFKNLMRRIRYNEGKFYIELIDRVEATAYWSTHGGELIGTDWERQDKCIEAGESWAVYFEDKWISEDKDEIWIGCTNLCKEDKNERHDCGLPGPETSLTNWWDNNLEWEPE